ncbi:MULTISPECIES: hypothetical protein [unclassified Pseudomonas]|uniref:hypothetical protein n=1 Tax=unclassified Pseudomonas TaxID=196821 RepID=UPI00380B1756
MSKPFDITLFLSGVLTGATASQQRHLRQMQIMQKVIQQRWHRDTPWSWQQKHVRWFLTQYLKDYSATTQYYYRLSALLVWKRLKRDSQFLIAKSVPAGKKPHRTKHPK